MHRQRRPANVAEQRNVRPQELFRNVLSQLKSQMDKIQHKRRMANTLQQINKSPKGQILVDLPLAQDDPPMIDASPLSKLNVNLKDYTMSFAITTTHQTLDEDGNLANQVQSTSPYSPITQAQVAKRLGTKDGMNVLIAFLNNYMRKMLKSMTFVDMVHIKLIKKITAPRKLTPNFDGMKTNCVIDIVSELLKTRSNYKTKLQPRLQALNEKYFDTGVGEAAIEEICKAVRVNITVISILKEEWFDCFVGETQKSIIICSHNGHATFYDPKKDAFVADDKVKKIKYSNDPESHFMKNSEPIKYPVVINDQIVAYHLPDGTMYKSKDIFFDDDDYKKNKSNMELTHVYTLVSRYYHELKRTTFKIDMTILHFTALSAVLTTTALLGAPI